MKKNQVPFHFRPAESSGSNSEADALLEFESLPLRRLLCALIHQAAEDLTAPTNYKVATKNHENRMAQKTARSFFESRAYAGICGLLGLSPSRIRDGAGRIAFDTPAEA